MAGSEEIAPVREEWKEGKCCYSSGLTLDLAKKIRRKRC